MGKIADRFANKKHPLYTTAREVIHLVQYYLEERDDEDFSPAPPDAYINLVERIEELLSFLTPEQFRKVTDLAAESVEHREDCDDILEALFGTIASSCEVREDADANSGYLIAIPLTIESSALLGLQDTTKQEELTKLFKSIEALAEDAEVVYLPVPLTAGEAEALEYGDLFRVGTALQKQDVPAATKIINAAIKRISASKATEKWAKPGPYQSKVIVAFIKTEDEAPFPLQSMQEKEREELFEQFGDAIPSELPDAIQEKIGAALSDIEKDVSAVLQTIDQPAADLLGVTSLRFTYPLANWFEAATEALHEQRNLQASEHLSSIIRKQGLAGAQDLAIAEEVDTLEAPDTGFKVTFIVRATGLKAGSLPWHALTNEEHSQCVSSLTRFISKQQGLSSVTTRNSDSADKPPLDNNRILH